MLVIAHYVHCGSIPRILNYKLPWILRILSWFSTPKSQIVLYSPYEDFKDIEVFGNCYSAWASSPKWRNDYYFVIGQIDERINEEQVLLTNQLAHKELFDALIFDKSEFTGGLKI